jgi:hypothetical protein
MANSEKSRHNSLFATRHSLDTVLASDISLHARLRPRPGPPGAPHRHRPDVRSGRLLCVSRRQREISRPLHGRARSRVGALHLRLSSRLCLVQSAESARHAAQRAAGPADRPLGPSAGLDHAEFLRAQISPARPGARDHLFDAVSGRRAVRPGARRVGRSQALGRDRCRLPRRAGRDAARPRRDPSWRAAIRTRRRCSIPTWSAPSSCCRSRPPSGPRRTAC